MTSNTKLAPVAITALLLVATLAGCAPRTTAAAGGGGATSEPATTAPTTRPANGGGLAALPTACPSTAFVDSTLGISAPPVVQTADAGSLNCEYISTDVANSLSINFTTEKKLTKAQAEAALKAQGSTPAFAEVSGLGDYAFYDRVASGGAYIVTISGSVAFHIVAPGSESEQQLEALAKAILNG
jgi:hypothetical protein